VAGVPPPRHAGRPRDLRRGPDRRRPDPRPGPVLARHQALLLAEARRLFPIAAAANPEFDDAVLAIVYAMQGAAIGLFSPDPDTEVAHLAFLERLARRELARTRRD
jgi:hypothetical protein